MQDKYLADWSGTRYGTPAGLYLPDRVEDLSQWLRSCHESDIKVAVQGGRTGVSGGCAPGDGEQVLALERLNRVIDFDTRTGIVVVESGMVLAQLQDLVEAEGWTFPLDLGSRGSCQLGGNAATNAGGSRVVKYGNMRNMVLGLEAVLADGSVLGPPNRLLKNNAGYSLTQLLIGSEGTLGVITRLALRLVPTPPARRTALLALRADAATAQVLHHCRRILGGALSAFEIMWPEYVDAALNAWRGQRALPTSFTGRRVVLLEAEGEDVALGQAMEQLLAQLLEAGEIHDAILSTSARDARDLWAIRESVGEIQATIRPYVGYDLGIGVERYDAFVQEARSRLERTGLPIRCFFFGHAGDGNLHCVAGPCHDDEQQALMEQAVYELMPALQTTVTAEHGVGRKKKSMLSHARSAADIAAMKAIKRAWDPKSILNPGRIFDL